MSDKDQVGNLHMPEQQRMNAPIQVNAPQQEQRKLKEENLYRVQKQTGQEYYKDVNRLKGDVQQNTGKHLVRNAIIKNLGSDRYAAIDGLKLKKAEEPSTQEIKLHHSAGTKLLAEGEDVIEFSVAGLKSLQYRSQPSADEQLKESRVRWYNKNKFLTWTGLSKTKKEVERDNKEIREKKEKAKAEREKVNRRIEKTYGDKYEEIVAGKKLNQLRKKEVVNQKTGATKTRFLISAQKNKGKYSEENIEEYILELGKSVLKQKLDEADWGEDDAVAAFRPVNIVLQGHGSGAVAVGKGAMRIRKWVADNYPRFLSKINFQMIQYDPRSNEDDSELDLADEKLAKKDPRYMPLGENANTTVVYSLKNMSDAPRKVKYAKRIILTMADHSVKLEEKDESQGTTTRNTYFAEKEGKVEAFRATGLGELDEGIYIADDHNNLIRLKSLEEYDALQKSLMKGEKKKDSIKAVRSVVKDFFRANGEEVTEEKKAKVKAKEEKPVDQEVKRVYAEVLSQLKDENEIWKKLASRSKAEDKQSVPYKQLLDAAELVRRLAARLTNKNGELSKRGAGTIDVRDLMDAMNRLSETANIFYDTHRGHQYTQEGKDHRAACDMLRQLSDEFYDKLNIAMGGVGKSAITEKPVRGKISTKDGVKAGERISEMASVYAKWKKHFAFREGSERINIRDKANMFAAYQKDIEIYKSTHLVKDWPADVKDAIRAANDYQFRNAVIEKVEEKTGGVMDEMQSFTRSYAEEMDNRSKGKNKLKKEEVDQNLSPEQVQAVESIDKWFIRNYNNAGLAGRFIGVRNHHGEIISALLAKSKRERLFIYYLIETGKRKSPEVMDAYASQGAYMPDLDKFKDQMLASKLKVMSRVFGGYVYMHKLTEAMQINEDYQELISDCAELDVKDARPTSEFKDKPVEYRAHLLKDLYTSTKHLRDEQLKYKKDYLDKKKKNAGKEEELHALERTAQLLLEKLIEADETVGKEKSYGAIGEKGEKKAEQQYNLKNQNLMDLQDNTGMAASAGSALAANAGIVAGWGLKDSALAKFNFVSNSITANSIAGAGQVLSAVYSIYHIAKNHENMHYGDIIGQDVASAVKSVLQTTTAIWTGIESGKQYQDLAKNFVEGAEITTSTALKGVGVATAGITALQSTYQTVSGTLDLKNNKNASKYLNKKINTAYRAKLEVSSEGDQDPAEQTEERRRLEEEFRRAKYDKNIKKLSKDLGTRKAAYSAIQAVGAGLSIAGVFIPVAGMVVGLAGTALTTVAGVLSGMHLTSARTMMFDDYFQFDKYLDQAKAVMKKNHRKIYNEEEFANRMRRTLMASLGYSDLISACDQIAKRYADQIRMRLFGKPDEQAKDKAERDGYIQMIKSFGLPYDEKKKVPSLNALARKMNGR
ncbi:MAG: hypothetical protein IKN79_03605 [Eubacterium sp.]|nr:hypothetical protein [Eubacterium sp.]